MKKNPYYPESILVRDFSGTKKVLRQELDSYLLSNYVKLSPDVHQRLTELQKEFCFSIAIGDMCLSPIPIPNIIVVSRREEGDIWSHKKYDMSSSNVVSDFVKTVLLDFLQKFTKKVNSILPMLTESDKKIIIRSPSNWISEFSSLIHCYQFNLRNARSDVSDIPFE